VRREVHAGFCEGPGVRFPRATLLVNIAVITGPPRERPSGEHKMDKRINQVNRRWLRELKLGVAGRATGEIVTSLDPFSSGGAAR
jgi:hypothetical protein